jgi:hypothetical protein
MVPPVEQRVYLRLIDRVAEVAASVFLDHAPRHIVDLPVALQGIQDKKQASFMIVQFINTGAEIGFRGQDILCGGMIPRDKKAQEEKAACDEWPKRHTNPRTKV